MRDFFKPCRRKIGVVTLVLACAFMAGWIRSQWIHDEIHLVFGNGRIGIYSICGEFALFRWKLGKPFEFKLPSLTLALNNEIARSAVPYSPWSDEYEFDWRWSWNGFHFGSA